MNYELNVNDRMGWISSIAEYLNNDTTLILLINFRPKYLSINDAMSVYGEDQEEYGISFLDNENTLADGEHGIGEVFVKFEDNNEVFHTHQSGRYDAALVFIKINFADLKMIYPKEEVSFIGG